MSTNALESLYQEDLYLLPSRTIIILNTDWSNLSEADKILLTKILGSVKLSLPSVQIQTRPSLDLASLAQFTPQRVIVFGSQAENLKHYEYIQHQDMGIVVADALNELDDVKKKNLWGALKQMFAV